LHVVELPKAIGRYEILGRLATGGMAEILLGRISGPSGFERLVVVKRILPHLARQQRFVAMFLDEARIVARIRHSNVVQVQELGQEGEELYITMEYLEGESVAGLLKRLVLRGHTLGAHLAAYVVAEACAGLHAAHELEDSTGAPQGLVHRDVSPQNVFVTYQGQVKVIDFGVVKAHDRMARTEAGQLKGKWEYMAPEQYLGKTIDRRADVFALGILLYELGTMRRLFKRFNEMLTMKAITKEPVTPPSRVVPDFPASLEAICLKALARSRDERYATAAEMRRDLLAAMRGLPASAQEPEPSEALAALMREHFAERIEEKGELLRRVKDGVRVTNVPAAETDERVEVPGGEGLTTTGTTSSTESPVTRRRSAWGAIALAGVLLMGGAAFAIVQAQSRRGDGADAAHAAATAPASVSGTEPAPATASASPSAAASESASESASTPAFSATAYTPRPRRPSHQTGSPPARPAATIPSAAPAPNPPPTPASAPSTGYHRFN
jgi:serine/threonine-protein kinase